MADLYSAVIEGTTVGANSRKLLGDGALGAGPYTSFGTPKLQAIKIISATINFASTANYVNGDGVPVTNGAFAKAVFALQGLAEIYYVGIPTASGANQFIAMVNVNKTDIGDGYATYGSDDGSYENIEDAICAALGTAENDVTVTSVALTGLTFA
jgi:hypothetical protein